MGRKEDTTMPGPESCTNASRTARNYSSNDAVCQSDTPREDQEARRLEREREAARKLDAYVAAHEGGMCSKSGASQAVAGGLATPDWTAQQKAAARTAKTDRPIESDAVGNALIGVVAGGVLGGVEAAVAGKTASAVVAHATSHAASHAALDAVVHGAAHAGHDVTRRVVEPETPDASPSAATSATPAPPPVPAGRSGTRGVSEPAKEPSQSTAPPPPAGQDRVPYAPGKAPLVVPYAPASIQG
jgi:hypothetical protein